MICAIYPNALSRGIPVDVFWSASVPDLLDMMTAIDDEEQRVMKEKVMLAFTQAEATASRIGFMFEDPKKRKKSEVLQPWDVYPKLFESEKMLNEVAEDKQNLEQQRLAMQRFARRRNAE